MAAKNKQQTQCWERFLEDLHESGKSTIKTGKPNILMSLRADSGGLEHVIKLKGQTWLIEALSERGNDTQ